MLWLERIPRCFRDLSNRDAGRRTRQRRGLNAAGFSNQDISVLIPDNEGSRRDFAHEKNTKAPEGTAGGAVAGGAVGGTLGLLAGIGALAIPGIGPLIAAGPLVAALAGIGAGGAVGSFVGALVGMGIPEYEAKRYEGRVKDGGVLLFRPLRHLRRDQSRQSKCWTARVPKTLLPPGKNRSALRKSNHNQS